MNPPPAPQQYQALAHAPSMISQSIHSVPTALPKQLNGYQASLTSPPSLPFPPPSMTLSSHVEIAQTQIPSSDPLLSLGQQPAGNTCPESSFQFTQPLLNPRIHEIQQQISLPDSSPPSSSAKSGNDDLNRLNGPSDASGDGRTEAPSALLASLRQSTCLYDLPRTQLEQLVGEVVQEEGFAKLASYTLLRKNHYLVINRHVFFCADGDFEFDVGSKKLRGGLMFLTF
ncbi:hypothetical protein C0989_001505 [Termitomyces sp. Mn162]|nr:hypothetical protein C0989_001505 [Termitomyces sp. Mn162]